MLNLRDQVHYLGESILEKIQYADSVRRKGGVLSNRALSDLIDLTESFSSISMFLGDSRLIEESGSYEYVTEKLIAENSCHKIFEAGFFNPFDDDCSSEGMNTVERQYEDDYNEDDGVKIKRVRVWNSNTKNKIMYVDGKMIAGQYFNTGDTIEKCPCRMVKDSDLYSNEIRKIAFPVYPRKRLYAIPFGYGICYRNSKQFGLEGNADYSFDVSNPNDPRITIIAEKRIKKGDEIVLNTDDLNFENEVKPGQFNYIKKVDPYNSIKSVRIA